MANERIFISYKRKNKEQVFALVDKIERELGVKCWVDLDGIESMAQFASRICKAIDKCDFVLFMHSSEHLSIDYERDWTIRELSYADHKQKRVFLVKLDDAELEDYFLLMFGALNYTDSRDPDQWKRLLHDLRGLLGTDGSNVHPLQPVPQRHTPLPSDQVFNVGGVEFKMICVEGGTFTMGATQEQGADAFDDEKPAHKVTLSDYYIGEIPVTVELWNAVTGDSVPLNDDWRKKGFMTGKWWNEVQQFIRKLNEKSGYSFRLPTEAEWEFAARGGNKEMGYKYFGTNGLDNVDNEKIMDYLGNFTKTNELGLRYMGGYPYVEWCADLYGKYQSGHQVNPQGAIRGEDRVLRGRGKVYEAEERKYYRLSARAHQPEDPDKITELQRVLRQEYISFRLALSTQK